MDQSQSGTPINNTSPSMPNNGMNGNTEKKNVGPIVATLVIVLILIIAALYVFASHLNQQAIPDDSTVNADNTSTSTQTVAPVTNSSTDVQSLQKDLNSATQGVDQQSI